MAEETRREFRERTQGNSQDSENKGTVTRPTTSNTVSRPTASNTVTRPSSSNTVSRPTSSNTVSRPTASNTVTRPSSSNTVSRPTSSNTVSRPTSGNRRPTVENHRVDAPVGKGQYLNKVEDTTNVITRYGIHVYDAGPYPEQVAEVMFGEHWRESLENPRAEYGLGCPEEEKEWVLTSASKAIALGAKVKVEKAVKVEHVFPGLKKGCKVVDESEAYTTFTMKVNSWGSSQSQVQELLLGKGGSSNLKLNLPIELTYSGREKDAMMTLAQQLVDLDVEIEITKSTSITVPLN